MSHPVNKLERFTIGDTKGKRRTKGIWNNFKFEREQGDHEKAEELLITGIRRRRKTTKLCSCPMCGNQRKIYGPTMQEIRFNEKTRTQD
jgi:hypothetical protein